MRAIVLTALLAVTACSSNSVRDSGITGSRSFDAAGFDAVSLEGPDSVIVRTGGAASVTATGDTAVLDRLTVEVVNGILRIGREKSRLGMNWGSGSSATITVTLPAIKAASVAGSGDLSVDTVAVPAFEASVAGSGTLTVAALKTDSVTVSLAGSGDATLAGTTRTAKYSVAASGDVHAGDLVATDADVSLAGSGGVTAGATGHANVSIVGSGDVKILGGATCSVTRIGSGDVRCAPAAGAAPAPPPT